MSIKIMTWVWEQDISFAAKIILLAMADHADDRGYCWPGTRSVAEKCGMSRPTLYKHLALLRQASLLCVEHREDYEGRTRSNGYWLHVPGSNLMHACKDGFTPLCKPVFTECVNPCLPEPPSEPSSETPVESSYEEYQPTKSQAIRITQVDNTFREQMRQRFGPVFGDTVQERIDEALAHKSASKWHDLQSYVRGWLRRDAEKISTTPNRPGVNHGRSRQHSKTDGYDPYVEEANRTLAAQQELRERLARGEPGGPPN